MWSCFAQTKKKNYFPGVDDHFPDLNNRSGCLIINSKYTYL